MRISWLALGKTGIGHAGVWALAFLNAIRRKGLRVELKLYVNQDQSFHLLRPYFDDVIHWQNRGEVELQHELLRFSPQVLVVEMHYFSVQSILSRLRERGTCSVLLGRQVNKSFFEPNSVPQELCFRAECWDLCLGMEEWDAPDGFQFLHPIVLREPDEILSAKTAKRNLKKISNHPLCVLAETGLTQDREKIWNLEAKYQNLGYETKLLGLGRELYFPLVDYYHGIDFLVIGAGYNAFWESRYFAKSAEYVVHQRQFEDQEERVRRFSQAHYQNNGANELVEVLRQL